MTPFRDDDAQILLGLNATGVVGLEEATRLMNLCDGDLARLGDPVLHAAMKRGRWPGGLVEAIEKGDLLSRGRRDIEHAGRHGIAFTIAGSSAYPPSLMQLTNPPLVIWHKGRLPGPDSHRVGIVGSRVPTRYGLRQSSSLGCGLSEFGAVVVSGLARGIDGAAHEGALSGGADGVAILGCGLAEIYPPEHAALAERIAAQGCVLSEFSPTMPPLAANFPRRNRIIAALVEALIVVEARKKSGALITARWAADLGRPIFVVPGQIDNPAAEGVLDLLQDGATPIRKARDVFEAMSWEMNPSEAAARSSDSTFEVSPSEASVLALLDHEAIDLDVLLTQMARPASEIMTILLSLELRGFVEQEPGLRFRRATA